jgi:hypothetical protein
MATLKYFYSTDQAEVQKLCDTLSKAAGYPFPPMGYDEARAQLVRGAYWASTPEERALIRAADTEGWTWEQTTVQEEIDKVGKRFLLEYYDDVVTEVLPYAETLYNVKLETIDLTLVTTTLALSADTMPSDWNK